LSRVLLAWEIGAGYGHVQKFRPLAQALQAKGMQPVAVVRDLAAASEVLSPYDVPVLQAPMLGFDPKILKGRDVNNYADILLIQGYGNTKFLSGVIDGWCSLIELIKPELIVADFAPSATLAATITGVNKLFYGVPYVTPSKSSPHPSLRPWLNVPKSQLKASEKRVVNTINVVLRRKGTPAIQGLSELFDTNEIYHCGLPEFDPYGPRDGCIYTGPLGGFENAATPQWAKGEGKKILAYLHADHPQLSNLIKICRINDLRLLIYVPGYSGKDHLNVVDDSVRFSSGPIDFQRGLTQANLVISGGAATLTHALLNGRPILAFPMQLEQRLFAYHAKQLGVGEAVSPWSKPDMLEGLLLAALNSTRLLNNAQAFSESHQLPDQETAIGQIAMACERLVQQGAST